MRRFASRLAAAQTRSTVCMAGWRSNAQSSRATARTCVAVEQRNARFAGILGNRVDGMGLRKLSTSNSSSDGENLTPTPPPQYEIPALPSNVVLEDESVLDPAEDLKELFEYVVTPGPKSAPFFRLTKDKTLEAAGEYELNEKVWSTNVRTDIIHRVVEWQRAKRRQGTKKVKTISERSGTGKKPFPQKGTGRARQGQLRSPHMRKGGRVHGPNNPDYSYDLPKKVRRFGLRATLSARYIEGNVFVVDTFARQSEDDEGGRWKTRDVKSIIDAQGWGKVAFVDAYRFDEEFSKATDNLFNAQLFPSKFANVYDLLKFNTIVLSKTGLAELEERLDEGKQLARKLAKRRAH